MTKKVVTKESIELKRLRSESKAFSDYTSRMAQHANENVETISRLTATVRDLQSKLSVADTNCRDLDGRLLRSEAERNGYIEQLQQQQYDDTRVPELERQLKAAQDRAATAFLEASKCDAGFQNKYDAMKECVRILENLIVRLALNGDR